LGTEGEKGAGLGLHLCKEFVERNNGQILVVSQVGLGTTFTIYLLETLPVPQVG
jgi:signal transduction histidine kinase